MKNLERRPAPLSVSVLPPTVAVSGDLDAGHLEGERGEGQAEGEEGDEGAHVGLRGVGVDRREPPGDSTPPRPVAQQRAR